jgi:hypothetical protein
MGSRKAAIFYRCMAVYGPCRSTWDRQFHSGDSVLVRDFRGGGTDQVKWVSGTLLHRLGSCVWSVKVQDKVWRRHANQIQMRRWSNSDDFLLLDPINIQPKDDIPEKQDEPPVIQDTQILRRSDRVRKPVRRLIQEI